MKKVMKLVSLQVGLPETRRSTLDDGQEAVWTSSIFKRPVMGRAVLGEMHFEGDGQADLTNHGGRDKAVCAYASEHYDGWQTTLGREMPWGAFGKNWTALARQCAALPCLAEAWKRQFRRRAGLLDGRAAR